MTNLFASRVIASAMTLAFLSAAAMAAPQ